MEFIKRFSEFLKKIFRKKEDIKMLNEPQVVEKEVDHETNDFFQALKVQEKEFKKKPKIIIPKSVGDGLGIMKNLGK